MFGYELIGRKLEYITEPYVCSPPASHVIAEDSTTFILGVRMRETDKLKGLYLFNVLVDGIDTGEFASKIEKKGRKVRILTRTGWKVWTGRSFL